MKKLSAILLCLAMSTAMVACGGGTQGTQGTTASTEKTSGTTAASTTGTPKPEPASKTFDENNIILSFGAISDIHLTGENDVSESKFRSALAQLKAEAAKKDKNGLAALAIAGDIADTGKKTQVDFFTKIIKESGIETVMLAPGNHDHEFDAQATMQYFLTSMGESYFEADVDKTMLAKGARHCVVNGQHFFFLEPLRYGDNCPYDKDVLAWLDSSLAKITAEDPYAYVYVFTHPMPYNTCYGSTLPGGRWYTMYLKSTLSKYPQVVTFGGHLHFPVNDERSIMQTTFTAIGCGSVRYLAIDGGYSNMQSTYIPKDAHDVSSGLLVQVDASGNVRITRMDFSNNATFKTPWELPHPTQDGSHLTKYSASRADGNKAPTLTGTPVLTPKFSPATGAVSGAMLTVPAGSDDDIVHHYEVIVKNEATGEAPTYKFLSDFYRKPTASDMAKTLTFPLSITSAGEYTIEVTAVDSWGAKSGKITCKATLEGNAGALTAELPEVYTDFEFAGGTVTDTKGKFNITVNGATVVNTPLTFAGKTQTVGALKISAAGQNAIVKFKDYTASTLTNFYNSTTGFSVEALYINYAPGGSQGIVCGTQSPGGWGLAESNGVPYFFTYIGSGSINAKASAASSKTELNHVVGTVLYDSVQNKTFTAFYINGKLVSSGSCEGKVGVHTSESVGTVFCFGADPDKNGGASDFKMSNFVLADAKIYSNALNFKQVETAYNNAVAEFN